MSSPPSTGPPADPTYEQQLRDMNEVLLLSSVRQHELAEKTEIANVVLRESERRFREMVDVLPAAVYTTDAVGRLTHANPAAVECSGRMAQLGTDQWCVSWKMCRPDGTPLSHSACPMSLALSEGRSIRGEEIIVERPDGTRRWFEAHATPLRDEQGQVIGGINMLLDITERRLAEQTLRESNARFESLFDASPVGVYLVDADLRIRLMSRVARSVFGDIGEEVIGSHFVEVIHILWPPASADDIVAHFQHTLETGEPYAAPEFSEERYDRKVREYYDWQIYRIALPDGQYGVVCYFIDISARVLAEQKFHESEVRYRRLFEEAKDGILILDFSSGKIVDANPFMSELLGYSHDEFSGKELWEIGLFSDKSASEAAVRGLQELGYVRFEHLPLESDLGRRVEVEVVANVYRECQHNLIQCSIRDITERSLLEKQLREQATELSDLHRRKDEFLAMLSHELRNPLAPIANAVQMLGLQRGSESPIQLQARAIIERQVGRLQHLIDDLLEVSRITTGKVHLRRELVPVSHVVQLAVESVRPVIERLRHELRVSLPPGPIWLFADASRLEQVVVNLLSNAAKYTPAEGHIDLSVSVEYRDESGEWRVVSGEKQEKRDEMEQSDLDFPAPHPSSLTPRHSPLATPHAVIRVRDSGVGIAPELLPRIFDLFTQADRSLDRSQGGLGIGLALVQRLTELHGGTVEAFSNLGQGSEFVVRLPVSSIDAPRPALPVTDTTAPVTRLLRVLVVDDNVDAAMTLGMLLEATGHEVRTAIDGPSALEAARAFHPHVVLLDIGLPWMDGYEVAQKMRQDVNLKHVVLVALTGYGQETDRQRSRGAGFDHHLVKPADFGKLQEILATAAEHAT